MLATTALAFLRAVSSSATWPAGSAPIVGTNATFLRDIWARWARHSAIVRTTCMGRKLYGDRGRWPIAGKTGEPQRHGGTEAAHEPLAGAGSTPFKVEVRVQ